MFWKRLFNILMTLIEKIDKLKFSLSNTEEKIVIIVEGKHDKEQLEKLGFRGIIMISGHSILSFINKINHLAPSRVIILTDFDRAGEEKASQLTSLLQKNRIKIDYFFRKKFHAVFNVNKIEEINYVTKFFEHDYHGSISLIHDKIFCRHRAKSPRTRKPR